MAHMQTTLQKLIAEQTAKCPEDCILNDAPLMTSPAIQSAIMRNPDKAAIPGLVTKLAESVAVVKELTQ